MMHNNSSLIAFSKVPNPTKFQKTLGINDFYFGDGDGRTRTEPCRCSARATRC